MIQTLEKEETSNKENIDVNKLCRKKEIQEQYPDGLDKKMSNNIKGNQSSHEKWKSIVTFIKNTATSTIGLCEKPRQCKQNI